MYYFNKINFRVTSCICFYNKSCWANVISVNALNSVYVNRIIQFSSLYPILINVQNQNWSLIFTTFSSFNLEKVNIQQNTLPTTNSTWTEPGPNPGHRGEKSATNLLNHSTNHIICTHINQVTDIMS